MRVEIRNAFTPPQQIPDARVFIDVFRASTTSLALLDAGVDSLLIANDLKLIQKLSQDGYLLVSEVFDLGIDNSPTIVKKRNLQRARAVLKTANLTTAIEKNIFKGPMFIGCFNNIDAIANYIQKENYHSVELIPAGLMAQQIPLLEDSHFAEALKAKLTESPSAYDPELLNSHIKKLKEKEHHPDHYWDDLALAIQLNISKSVPSIQIEGPNLFRCKISG